MNRYKVTTEVTFFIRADSEDEAIEITGDEVRILPDGVPSGYYEVEEVLD